MNDDLSLTNLANIEMNNLENAIQNSMLTDFAENVAVSVNPDSTPPLPSSEAIASSSASTLANVPPRYLTAVSQRAVNPSLEESAFPPLPGVSENAGQTSPRYSTAVNRRGGNSSLEEAAFPSLLGEPKNVGQTSKTKGKKSAKSMAAVLLGCEGNARVLNAAGSRRRVGSALLSSSHPVSSFVGQTNVNHTNLKQTNVNQINNQNMNHLARSVVSSTSGTYPRVSTIVNDREMMPMLGEFPPISGRQNGSIVSGTENQSSVTNIVPLLSVEETRAANRTLIESIRSGLGGDEQQFEAFKYLSAEFRNGSINAQKYHTHISQLGLSHLVLELARLCPDKDKQRELVEAHNVVMKNSQNSINQITSQIVASNTSNNINLRRKEKNVDMGCNGDATSSSASDSACCMGNTSDEVEVLSKDGYRTAKGKVKPSERQVFNKVSGSGGSSSDEQADWCQRPPPLPDKLNSSSSEKWSCNACTLLNNPHSMLCLVCGSERPDGKNKDLSRGGKEKQKKKTSKSQRVSLADFSVGESSQNSSGGSVWGNGGGQRLLSMAQNSPVGGSGSNR